MIGHVPVAAPEAWRAERMREMVEDGLTPEILATIYQAIRELDERIKALEHLVRADWPDEESR